MFRVARGKRVKSSTNSPPPHLSFDRWATWAGNCSFCCFWDTLVVCCKLVDLIYKVFQITGAGYYMVHNYFTVWLGGDVSHSMKATITLILNIRPDTFTSYVQTYDLVWRHISAVIISETMHHCTKIKATFSKTRNVVGSFLSSGVCLFFSILPSRCGTASSPQPLLPSGPLWRQRSGPDQHHHGQGWV